MAISETTLDWRGAFVMTGNFVAEEEHTVVYTPGEVTSQLYGHNTIFILWSNTSYCDCVVKWWRFVKIRI